MHEKLASFFFYNNKLSYCPFSLCLCAYWQWKLANERLRISVVILINQMESLSFYVKQNKKRKQTLESAQYGPEIIFKGKFSAFRLDVQHIRCD